MHTIFAPQAATFSATSPARTGKSMTCASNSLCGTSLASASPARWSASSCAATMHSAAAAREAGGSGAGATAGFASPSSALRCASSLIALRSSTSSMILRTVSNTKRSRASSMTPRWRSCSASPSAGMTTSWCSASRPCSFACSSATSDGFLVVERDQALVQAALGREHRLDAEQHVEEAELRDVAAHHRDANGERRGEQQPHRAPEPGPEDHRGDDRDGREPGAAAVKPRLDAVDENQLEHDEHADGPGDQRPAVGNGERQRHRHRDRDPDPRHRE